MIAHAKATYVRLSPQKARYVADLVRNKSVTQAYSILRRTNRKPAEPYTKLIMSAADAAIKVKKQNLDDLYVSKIVADSAGMMKRWRSMSMGRAGQICKRMSHLSVELSVLPEKRHSIPASNQKATIKPVKKKKDGASK